MKILKGRVTGTFSNDVDVWLDDEDWEEIKDDVEAQKDALTDAWSYVEYEDIEVDDESLVVSDG